MTKKATKKKASKKKASNKRVSKKVAAKVMGRPSRFTDKIAAEILTRLAAGDSLRRICTAKHLPHESTVRHWVVQDEHGDFAAQYTRARDLGMDAMADELLDIADDGSNDWMETRGEEAGPGWRLNGEHVQRSRLRLDTRKFLLSKIAAKKYGNKLEVTEKTELQDATDEQLAVAIKQRLEAMADQGFDLSEYLKSNGGDT